ncbi:hypothetical protein IF2G_09550 [Cordyceps javanica]|nr:hypothetical protein IF2G_09550 [Cordyceps javanica]
MSPTLQPHALRIPTNYYRSCKARQVQSISLLAKYRLRKPTLSPKISTNARWMLTSHLTRARWVKRPLVFFMAAHLEIDMIWSNLHVCLCSNLGYRPTKSGIRMAYSQRSAFYRHFLAWETRLASLVFSFSATNNLRSASLEVRRILVNTLLNVDYLNPERT